jgi:hypothetical protein
MMEDIKIEENGDCVKVMGEDGGCEDRGGVKIYVKSENSWAKDAVAAAEEATRAELAKDNDMGHAPSMKITKNISKANMSVVQMHDTISLESWMEDNYVENALLFDSLNVVPTTHNSAAVFSRKIECCVPWLWAKCQGYTIRDQLMMGVRCLDLRLRLIRDDDGGNRYQIVHFFDSTYTFMEVMKEVNDFLEENNGETVFVMIKPDWNTRKDWKYSDLEDLWGKIGGMERVLKDDGDEYVKLNELRFKHVRGKMVFMPDGHIYKTYNKGGGGGGGRGGNGGRSGKVNRGKDVDVIHGVRVVYPDFLNRCENWNSNGVRHTKQRIESFLAIEKQRASSLERRMEGDESKMFPLVETNVVLFKGTVPPYMVAKCMHPYLKRECVQMECVSDEGMCYVKRLGFVLVDFANEGLIRKLLSNNICKYY